MSDPTPARAARAMHQAAARRRGGGATARPDLREECGVFGMTGTDDAAAFAVFGLHALQHRGQESVGVVTYDGDHFHTERSLGLVSEAFRNEQKIRRLRGRDVIGHVRYSTQGGTLLRNVQPLYADLDIGGLAVANNGNLTNAIHLREQLVRRGCIFQSTTDTELFLQLTATSRKSGVIDRFVDALRQVEGGYAVVALSNDILIGARDPVGIRPLVLGEHKGRPVLCSETCALDAIGAAYVRDVAPGEVVWCAGDRVESLQAFPAPDRPRPCVFEYVYFARADSVMEGRSVYEVRKSLGRVLAQERPVEADIVSPVPDTGTPAAMGYAAELGAPFEFGLIRNNYVGRTFIQPTQELRELGVRRKHSANKAELAGKRVVLIDDSIVRGTTSGKIVEMVREAGAREVHMRVASPPIRYPDYYGIDMPERDRLIAANHSVEEIARIMNVDSLGYISIDGLYRALGHEGGRDPHAPAFTDHYFTGDYPTPLTDLRYRGERTRSKAEQLSLLSEKT